MSGRYKEGKGYPVAVVGQYNSDCANFQETV
jgi:hypothetical protein